VYRQNAERGKESKKIKKNRGEYFSGLRERAVGGGREVKRSRKKGEK